MIAHIEVTFSIWKKWQKLAFILEKTENYGALNASKSLQYKKGSLYRCMLIPWWRKLNACKGSLCIELGCSSIKKSKNKQAFKH